MCVPLNPAALKCVDKSSEKKITNPHTDITPPE